MACAGVPPVRAYCCPMAESGVKDSWEKVAELQAHSDWVAKVQWSPDGSLLASSGFDASIRIIGPTRDGGWDPISIKRKQKRTASWDRWSPSLAWAPDGSQLASTAHDDRVRVWDAANGQVRRGLRGHAGRVLSVGWSPDGLLLASGGSDGRVRLWNVRKGVCEAVLNASEGFVEEGRHPSPVRSLAWSSDGSQLVSFCHQTLATRVRVWDIRRGECVHELLGSEQFLSVSPGGSRLLAYGRSGSLQLWDAATGAALEKLDLPRYQLHLPTGVEAAWSPNGSKLAVISFNDVGNLTVCDVTTGKSMRFDAQVPDVSVSTVAWSPDGSRLLCGGFSGVRVFDSVSGTCVSVLESDTASTRTVAWARNGHLASGHADGTVRVWREIGEIGLSRPSSGEIGLRRPGDR